MFREMSLQSPTGDLLALISGVCLFSYVRHEKVQRSAHQILTDLQVFRYPDHTKNMVSSISFVCMYVRIAGACRMDAFCSL
jgi:hypothetical protein